MNSRNHIINKILFEVNTPDTKMAYYLKDNLDMFLEKNLFPSIQSYFDSISEAQNGILRFDKLELEINSNNARDKVQLQLDIMKSLQKQISIHKETQRANIDDNTSFSIVKDEKNDLDTFFYFLKTGQNPWWNSELDKSILDKGIVSKLIENKSFLPKLKKLLSIKTIRQRLVYQYEDVLLLKILNEDRSSESFSSNKKTITKLIKKYFTQKEHRNTYWEIIARYTAEPNIYSLKNSLAELILGLKKEKLIHNNIPNIQISNESLQLELKESPMQLSQMEILKGQILKELNNQNKGLKTIGETIKKLNKRKSSIELETIFGKIKKSILIGKKDINQKDNEVKGLVKIITKEYYKNRKQDFELAVKEILEATSQVISEKLEFSQFPDVDISISAKDFNMKKTVELSQEDSAILNQEDTNDQYIKNAGLVLLHPYLTRFFTATKLMDDTENIKPDKIELAIHLLHYLATKKEQQLESNLTFEKFLCGFPIHKPIRRDIKLSKSLKKEADDLLTSVLKNWKALRNTSPDGLREAFMQRKGKLVLDEETKYRIIVEKKTQDILLDKLPWNLNLIRLPWIDKLIFVEW